MKSPRREHIEVLDNIRYLMIVLVIVYHSVAA
jgi:hypothetical protein